MVGGLDLRQDVDLLHPVDSTVEGVNLGVKRKVFTVGAQIPNPLDFLF